MYTSTILLGKYFKKHISEINKKQTASMLKIMFSLAKILLTYDVYTVSYGHTQVGVTENAKTK